MQKCKNKLSQHDRAPCSGTIVRRLSARLMVGAILVAAFAAATQQASAQVVPVQALPMYGAGFLPYGSGGYGGRGYGGRGYGMPGTAFSAAEFGMARMIAASGYANMMNSQATRNYMAGAVKTSRTASSGQTIITTCGANIAAMKRVKPDSRSMKLPGSRRTQCPSASTPHNSRRRREKSAGQSSSRTPGTSKPVTTWKTSFNCARMQAQIARAARHAGDVRQDHSVVLIRRRIHNCWRTGRFSELPVCDGSAFLGGDFRGAQRAVVNLHIINDPVEVVVVGRPTA